MIHILFTAYHHKSYFISRKYTGIILMRKGNFRSRKVKDAKKWKNSLTAAL